MTHGQFLPPDPSAGDETTVRGYAAVHARPAALEGKDGVSYSVDVLTDVSDDAAQPYAAYLLFVQWSRLGAQKVDGHLESEFLAWGETAEEAEQLLGDMTLEEAKRALDALIVVRDGQSSRRWFDVMREEDAS
ncbi:MAG: hypothetical protein NTZ43_12270 [Gemmatimonadetes bacterium]|nr:hypothetical protein [Gemmatimonadota bacterium]